MALFPTRTVQTALREIDVSGFVPIIEHPSFLRLGRRTQLSCVDQVFPGARHSRLEHAFFVFHFADELTHHLTAKNLLTAHQAFNLQIAALCHDIGHPPFSHAIEEVLGHLINPDEPVTHHNKAVELLLHGTETDSKGRTFHEAIRRCGGNPNEVADIVSKQSPIAIFISHNTLGVDKLGYLLLDSYHTGFHPQLPYILDIFPYYYYQDGELGVAEDKIAQVMNLQRVIQDMYEFVYYHPEVMQFVRMLQKATEMVNLSPQEVWGRMNEEALLWRLETSRHPTVRSLAERYARQELLDLILSCRHSVCFPDVYGLPDIHDPLVRIEPKLVEHVILKYSNPLNLTRLENAIEDRFNLPKGSVLVVLSGDPKRLIPEDVSLYNSNGRKQDTLFTRFPDHHQSLVERANHFFSLRVYGLKDVLETEIGTLRTFVEEYLNR